MNEIQIFNNAEFGNVRSVVIDNEPYFVGKDVAAALGYSDPQKALKMHVDSEDKLTRQIVVSGQNRGIYIINESGLYSLIMSSKLPAAKRFKRWITSEVLPQIRRTGSYAIKKKNTLKSYVFDNEPIVLIGDLTEQVGASIWHIRSYVKKYLKKGKDYINLRGIELTRFKGQNNWTHRTANSLTGLTEQGVKKLFDIYGTDVSMSRTEQIQTKKEVIIYIE